MKKIIEKYAKKLEEEKGILSVLEKKYEKSFHDVLDEKTGDSSKWSVEEIANMQNQIEWSQEAIRKYTEIMKDLGTISDNAQELCDTLDRYIFKVKDKANNVSDFTSARHWDGKREGAEIALTFVHDFLGELIIVNGGN